jgi:hypothetical protein
MKLAYLGFILFLSLSITIDISSATESAPNTNGNNQALLECLKTNKSEPCQQDSPYGKYVIPSGGIPKPRPITQATIIDLGGPGILPGALKRFDQSKLPASLIHDRLVIIVGSQWGIPKTSKACLDSLLNYVGYVRGSSQDTEPAVLAAKACQLESAVTQYGERSAALISDILSTWNIQSYDVVGASYAASRWDTILGSLDPGKHPSSMTFVSPLVADTPLKAIAEWQGSNVDRVWRTSCKKLSTANAQDKCIKEIINLSNSEYLNALMMVSWSPMAADELAGYIEDYLDQLPEAIGKFSKRYFFLNSVGYPRDELFEYFVGMCNSIVTTKDHTDTSIDNDNLQQKVADAVMRFHSICQQVKPTRADYLHNTPTCYVEFANERISPPATWSINGVNGQFRNVVLPSDHEYSHGDLHVLNEVNNCRQDNANQHNKIHELTPGLLSKAKSIIGTDQLFLPSISKEFDGEYNIGNILIAHKKDNNTVETTPVLAGAKISKDQIVGYCIAGWMIPESGVGRSHSIIVGLNGNKAPKCDRQKDVIDFHTTVGDLTIIEKIPCNHSKSQCHTITRKELPYLSNDKVFIKLI